MGSKIQRLFPGYATYRQDMSTSEVTIQIYFRCQGLKFPFGISNSVNISVNNELLMTYNVQQINTTLAFSFVPTQDVAMASIKIEFANNTIYDLDEYLPKDRVFKFKKNIFYNAKYQLASTFANFY